RAGDVRAARHAAGPGAARADYCSSRARRRSGRARCIDRGSPEMSHYQKPPELYDGLRLHQNENTGGCSPKVIEALARLRPDQIGFYPPYAEATKAVASYLGTTTDRIALTNGLDEGIMALAVAFLRAAPGGPVLES